MLFGVKLFKASKMARPVLFGVAASVSVASFAHAQTVTDTFQVTATVPDECIISASDLAFGNYSVTVGATIDGTTNLSITCSGGTAYVVSLDAGTGSGASVATRKMTSGANTLDYSLYQDAARTQLWGQTGGTDTVGGTGSGSAESISVYGQIAAAQPAAVGSYADTITATVTF